MAFPVLTIKDVILLEESSNGDKSTAKFEWEIDKASTEPTSFSWTTVDGTAIAGKDYYAASGSISIAPGTLDGSFEVELIKDDIQELSEDFTVAFSNANFLSFASENAKATITDNDKAGITLTSKNLLETSERGGSDSFQIVLNSEPTADVNFGISVSDDTEGRLSISKVTFTSTNWKQPQTIKIYGVNPVYSVQ